MNIQVIYAIFLSISFILMVFGIKFWVDAWKD